MICFSSKSSKKRWVPPVNDVRFNQVGVEVGVEEANTYINKFDFYRKIDGQNSRHCSQINIIQYGSEINNSIC